MKDLDASYTSMFSKHRNLLVLGSPIVLEAPFKFWCSNRYVDVQLRYRYVLDK